MISIHAPREGGDAIIGVFQNVAAISIHAPARGATWGAILEDGQKRHFNPRPPRGGRQRAWFVPSTGMLFQSTPPARGATSDFRGLQIYVDDFNPRPPRGGRRPQRQRSSMPLPYFNPRPPRGGRQVYVEQTNVPESISIHAPREGGDYSALALARMVFNFNPRPPREGRPHRAFARVTVSAFQSTPPARGATAKMHSFTCGSLTNK